MRGLPFCGENKWGQSPISPMPLAPELRAAYEAAHYVVFAEPELVIRIGEPNSDLDTLLEAEGALTAAYVTAANPHGVASESAVGNIPAQAVIQTQSEAGYACYEGEGRDPERAWPAEPSALIVGISRADAEELGRALEQNAIVFIEKGKAPELVVLV